MPPLGGVGANTSPRLRRAEAARARLGADVMIDGKRSGTGRRAATWSSAAQRRSTAVPPPPRPAEPHHLLAQAPRASPIFSGLFIGPTGAPRIDEARHDSLYELSRVRRGSRSRQGAPRAVAARSPHARRPDDVTGNTHTEISFDKLYSPDGPTGRSAHRVCRGFEMPPDARMSLAQQLHPCYGRPACGAIRSMGPCRAGARRCTTGSCFPLHWIEDFLDVLTRTCGRTASPSVPTGTRHRPSSASRFAARSNTEGADFELTGRRLSPRHVLRRDRRHRRHGPLHQFLDRTPAGQTHDSRSGPLCHRLQPATSANAA